MKSCPECYSEYEDALDKCPDDQTPLRVIEKDPLIGTKLADRYEVVSVIGRGGMGVVYKVRHETMDRFMAVKMLHSHLVSEAEAVMRFHREAKTVSQVKHHHIITLYDFGMSAQRQPYLVMDFLEGTSLKAILKEKGALSFERTGHIYEQVVDALQTAHGMDLVHRDLKPENIMLSDSHGEGDWVTLVDFGLSKLKEAKVDEAYHITKVGDVCGSPPYMSPEQCLSSQVVDPRSDIYSLAVCVYETLTCKLPFNVKSAIEMLDAHLYATPIPFNQALPEFKVCSEVTHVLNKALQKDPDKRHQSVQEFGAELNEAIRRDGLKLRAFRHRLEVSSFSDLISEAEALQKAEKEKEQQAEAQASLEGMQFMKSKEDPKNGAGQEAPNAVQSVCPYCRMPIQPGIKFCTSCQYNLPASVLGNDQKSSRGFTNRAKKATTSESALATASRVLGVLLLLVAVCGLILLNNEELRQKVFKSTPLASQKEGAAGASNSSADRRRGKTQASAQARTASSNHSARSHSN